MILYEIIDFFLYKKVGATIIRLSFLSYPILVAYIMFIRFRTIRGKKKSIMRLNKVIVVLIIVLVMIHIVFLKAYNLNMNPEEIQKIHVGNFQEEYLVIEDKILIQDIISIINDIEFRNSLINVKILGDLHFDRQNRFTLSFIGDDLMRHIVFIQYDNLSKNGYQKYNILTNKDAYAQLVNIKNYDDTIEDLYKLIYSESEY